MLAALSLLLAAFSLAFPSAPAYDPWAWIIWGREVLHLQLVTTGGPTWKPLPVVFTTLFAPFGDAAPSLWLLLARAGGLMGLGLAGLLATRLIPGPHRLVRAVAALLAALGLLTLSGYASSAAFGESEGMLVALTLFAILRHLDRAPREAFAAGFAAALIRPEAWPFLALYGAWLWPRDRGGRLLLVSLSVLIPVLWFVPELVGSGSALRGVQWARYPRAGSAAFARCPFCSELTREAWPLLSGPVIVGLVLALLVAARQARVLAGAAGAWILEEAVLTQAGFSGSPRYLLGPVAVLIVLGAAGWGAAVRTVGGRWEPSLTLGATIVAIVAAFFAIPGRGAHLGALPGALRFDARMRGDVNRAVDLAGGRRRLLAFGPLETNPSEAPLVAWTLGGQLLDSEGAHRRVVIQLAAAPAARALPAVPAAYRLLAVSGGTRVYVARSVSVARLAR